MVSHNKKEKKKKEENSRKMHLHLKDGSARMKWLRFHTEREVTQLDLQGNGRVSKVLY